MPFSTSDIEHVNGCKVCRNMMILWVRDGKQPLSQQLLAKIINKEFKAEIIKAACLRVAHLPIEEGSHAPETSGCPE